MALGIYEEEDIRALAKEIRYCKGGGSSMTVKEMKDEITNVKEFGFSEGWSDGWLSGNTEGLEKGRTEGIEEGKAIGYAEGKTDGLAEGIEQGKAESEAVTKSIIDRSVTEVVIPNGTTKIGNYAFSYCTSLKKITIPDGVTSIGSNGLNATSLTELVLPLSCESIGSYSLYSIYNLKKVVFGDIKTIGTNALGANLYCTVYDFSRCTTIPTLRNVNAFEGIATKAQIIVPASLYDEWIVATNWSQLASYIVAVE